MAVVEVCSEPVPRKFPEKQGNTGKILIVQGQFGEMLR